MYKSGLLVSELAAELEKRKRHTWSLGIQEDAGTTLNEAVNLLDLYSHICQAKNDWVFSTIVLLSLSPSYRLEYSVRDQACCE